MKRLYFLSTLMLIMMEAMLPQNISAQDIFYQTCSTGHCLRYSIIDSSKVCVWGSDTLIGDLVIPSSVIYNDNTYYVTSIGSSAFFGCVGLTSVTIGESVTTIGNSAFSGCVGLESVTIGKSVTFIGLNAFQNCTGLTKTNFMGTVSQWCKMGLANYPAIIANYWNPIYYSRNFYLNDTLLTHLVIPDSVEYIQKKLFYFDTCLKSLVISDSVASIRDQAFYGCSGLTDVTIGKSVTFIGKNAFFGCTNLTTINYNADSCSFDWSQFPYTPFQNCNNLVNMIIGNNVKILPDYFLYSSTSITSLTIANSVKSIGYGAFHGLTMLDTVYFNAVNMNGSDKSPFDSLPITVFYVGDNVQTIPAHICDRCTGLYSVIIPNTVSYIGQYAFRGCTGLTSVTIGNSVTSIGIAAFRGCTGLTSITVGESVAYIRNEAFYGCTGLTYVNLSESVTSIGDYAFQNCTGLTSMIICASVTSIGAGAFYHCNHISSLTFTRQQPPAIGNGAFSGVPSSCTVYIPCGTLLLYMMRLPNFANFEELEYNVAFTHSICEGESYNFYGQNLTTAGIYTHTLQTINGCDSVFTLTLTVKPLPTLSITGNTTLCEGASTILTANGGSIYLWSNAATTNSINVSQSGVYTVTATNAEGCSNTANVTVMVNPLPTITIGGNTTVCAGSSTTLTASGANSYSWSTGDNTASVNINAFGVYTVTGTSSEGCSNTASVTVLVSQLPVITITGETNICAGESTTLTANGGETYLWSDGNTSNTLTVSTAGTYQVIGYNAAGCNAMASATVNVWQPATSEFSVECSDSCYTWNSQTYCASGDYPQTLQTVHGCDSVVTLHLTITVGIDEHNLGASMTVYPNPTTGVVNVQCTMNNVRVGTMEFQLFDAFGRLLRTTDGVETQNFASLQTDTHGSSEQTQIDLSHCAAGTYFVKAVADGNVVAVKKVIKN